MENPSLRKIFTPKAPAGVLRRMEDDEAFKEFSARVAALDARMSALAEAQLRHEGNHPHPVPQEVVQADEVQKRARKMLAHPPRADAALPEKLPALLAERRVLSAALELAALEGRQICVAALNRVRAARSEEWTALVRKYALAVAHAVALEKQRDAMFAEIGFGPFGRQPLPMSECHLANGRAAISTLLDAAILHGVISEKDVR